MRILVVEDDIDARQMLRVLLQREGHIVVTESYITLRSEASFSHGVCLDCYETIVRPELDRSRSS